MRSTRWTTIRRRSLAAILASILFAPSCSSLRNADRSPVLAVGASFAGRNNPERPSGEEDNIAIVLASRLCVGPISLRPEVHLGEFSTQATPALTYDFPLLGEGLGSLDGNVGVGYSFLHPHENNVLGNQPSPFLRVGAEGYLAGGITVGGALLLAPWGYEREHWAVAGVTTAGVRF